MNSFVLAAIVLAAANGTSSEPAVVVAAKPALTVAAQQQDPPVPPGQGQASAVAQSIAPSNFVYRPPASPMRAAPVRCLPPFGPDNRFGEFRGGWRSYSFAPRYRGSARGYRR